MYKTTVDNTQSRARRSALHSTKNRHGVDRSAFSVRRHETTERYVSLLSDRITIHMSTVKLQRTIAAIYRKVDAGRGWNGWQAEIKRLERQIHRNQAALSRLKDAFTEAREARRAVEVADKSDIAVRFMEKAAQMLADPVFNRVLTAAIHAVHEDAEPDVVGLFSASWES